MENIIPNAFVAEYFVTNVEIFWMNVFAKKIMRLIVVSAEIIMLWEIVNIYVIGVKSFYQSVSVNKKCLTDNNILYD